MYTPTTWKDRAVQYAKRYFLRDNGGSDKNLLPPFNEGWTLHENTRMKQGNYVGKVSGSTTVNANISKNTAAAALTSPGGSWFAEETDPQYSNMSTLNATSTTHANTTNTYIMQNLYSFDLIEHVLRNYGSSVFGVAVTTPERVAWLKLNVAKLIVNWHGYGSSPSGNKAYLALWNVPSTLYDGTLNHTSGSVTKITQTSTSMTTRIDANGFVHFIAYADASNGTTASSINTDFVELEVYMAVGSIPQADYTLILNSTATDQYSTYTLNATPSTSYAFSMGTNKVANTYVLARELDSVGATIVDRTISTGSDNVVFTTNTNTTQIKIFFGNTTAGVYTWINQQLEYGSAKTSFSPMKTYDVTQAPGIVTQAGTPLNAANLNALETGLQATASTMDTHIALQTTVHGSTSAATANKLVHRDANGRAKVAAPSASDDIARLDTVEASRPYVSGSYTGDGSATRDIALSFTPSAVWVYPKYAMPSSSTYPTSGLAVTGSPAQAAAGVAAVAVGTTKFTVSYSTSGNDGRTNENAVVFHYIAFK
jgi:hypothetical protein